jgi:hypothetical protein
MSVIAILQQLVAASRKCSVISRMTALIYSFFALAVIGFVAMLLVHVSSLFGVTSPFDHFLKFLGPGVFVVFLPTVLVMNQLSRDFKQKDIWRAALRGCPQWMRRAVWVIFGYGWIGFFALPLLFGGGMDAAANKARSMSATLLIFYVIPVAILYSATQVKRVDDSRRCVNGHRVSPLAKFCEECGSPVAPLNASSGS